MSARDAGTIALIARLIALPEAERLEAVQAMSDAQRGEFGERWAAWAHDGQLAPPGDWRVWLIRAGRGFGKTRAGAEWIGALARATPDARIALVGATADDVRQVMIEGPSGLVALARDGDGLAWRSSASEVRWGNGAVATLFSAAAPERLRGPEHHAAWCDELGKWHDGDAAWDNLMMTMRLGDLPRVLVTTTPRATKLMRRLLALPTLVETRGRTRDNPHLPDSFADAMADAYGGTMLGRQELDGELIDQRGDALWSRALIEARRVRAAPVFTRVVIGVDPPAGSEGDACGIVAVGRDGAGAYVIEDASVARATPERWAAAVAACAARVGAHRIVAEGNQGGEMVRSVLLAADAGLPVGLVHASVGKAARAEPVSLLYERGKAFHAGVFPALEDELCGLIRGGGYDGPGRSPDRADALVYAMTELMLGVRGVPGVRGL